MPEYCVLRKFETEERQSPNEGGGFVCHTTKKRIYSGKIRKNIC